ncbi:hypothetical protein FOZ62_003883, partial [Perkinsus olseni]
PVIKKMPLFSGGGNSEEGRQQLRKTVAAGDGRASEDHYCVRLAYVERKESLDLNIYGRGLDALEKKKFLALLAEGHPELEDFSIDCGEGNNDLVKMESAILDSRLWKLDCTTVPRLCRNCPNSTYWTTE